MNTGNECATTPIAPEAQGHPCPQCQELGGETWLEAGTYYCDQCDAVYCPYCGTEQMKGCEHHLAASYSEADALSLMEAGFDPFPSLDTEIDPQGSAENLKDIAAQSFGPMLPIYEVYGYDENEESFYGDLRAGTILEACLEHLGVPFHAVNYETGAMGRSFGYHYFTQNAAAVKKKISALQGRLAESFEAMTQLLEEHEGAPSSCEE